MEAEFLSAMKDMLGVIRQQQSLIEDYIEPTQACSMPFRAKKPTNHTPLIRCAETSIIGNR